MPFEIKYHEDQDFVEACFTGSITVAMTKEYVEALIPILEETGCTRVLSDSRKTQVQLSSIDIMQLPRLVATSPLTAGLKRAAVASEGSSGYEMYEMLSKIQGQHLQVFTDRDRALEWLLSDD